MSIAANSLADERTIAEGARAYDGDWWSVHCDAAVMQNTGRVAVGAVIVAPGGHRHTVSRVEARRGCCNAGEALALIAALDAAFLLGARQVAIRCDSSVLLEQTVGNKRTAIPRLAVLYEEARRSLQRFTQVKMTWVPRHKNVEADALARAAWAAST